MAEYMVLLVDVRSGEVEDVFEAGMVKKNGREVKIHCKTTEPITTPFNIEGFKSDKAIGTFYAESSPG